VSNSNTQVRFKTTPPPRVIVKAFNANGNGWKDSSLSWLNEMRGQRFGLMEGHTLELRAGYRRENFILLVVRKSLIPMEPLPPRIYFDHFELDAQSGHDIHIDCSSSPPVTVINRHFWEQYGEQGKTPNFERYVKPLIAELVSNFEGGKSWAS